MHHHLRRVLRRERRLRTAIEVELGVGVHLDDREAVGRGELEQPRAPLGGEDGQGGVLSLRGDEHRAERRLAEQRLERGRPRGPAASMGTGRQRAPARTNASQARRAPRASTAIVSPGETSACATRNSAIWLPRATKIRSGARGDRAGVAQHARERLAQLRLTLGIAALRSALGPDGAPVRPRERRGREQPRIGNPARHLEQAPPGAGGRRRRLGAEREAHGPGSGDVGTSFRDWSRAGRCAGSLRETALPSPGAETSQPSTWSSWYADMTVLRLTPSCSARVR